MRLIRYAAKSAIRAGTPSQKRELVRSLPGETWGMRYPNLNVRSYESRLHIDV